MSLHSPKQGPKVTKAGGVTNAHACQSCVLFAPLRHGLSWHSNIMSTQDYCNCYCEYKKIFLLLYSQLLWWIWPPVGWRAPYITLQVLVFRRWLLSSSNLLGSRCPHYSCLQSKWRTETCSLWNSRLFMVYPFFWWCFKLVTRWCLRCLHASLGVIAA